MAKELLQRRQSSRARVERDTRVQAHIQKQEAEILRLRAAIQSGHPPSPPLRKRAALVEPKSEPESERDRDTHTPPTPSIQTRVDTSSETDDGSRSLTTDTSSETESDDSTDEYTDDSAASGDVLMDGESDEGEGEGSECSSSKEESDKGESDMGGQEAPPRSGSIPTEPEETSPDPPPTGTVSSLHTSTRGADGLARSRPRRACRDRLVPVSLPTPMRVAPGLDRSRHNTSGVIPVDREIKCKRDIRGVSWDSRIRELQEYLLTYGSWPEPPGELGRWVERKRNRKRAGKLRPARTAALEALGIDWNAKS
ncbi:hypothetical protein KIPB_010269 [Kipferlia bialata]|uniref:Helicase-associated domain-containing protein n=1 Tax=Kipferlia bialata TaxID=797122 RepID=A0A9K3D3N5_9EUKA|nr:hypothetical protein KIPB_010269 [Kipferlia bialata]|eukprot:g10269.t1